MPAHHFSESAIFWPGNQPSKTRRGRAIIRISSFFPFEASHIWQHLSQTRSLLYVCGPFIFFKPLHRQPLPAAWNANDSYAFSMRAYGFIPLGTHRIYIEEINEQSGTIQSRESGSIVSRWDHLITLESANGGTRYTDEVVVEAGILTALVAWWARLFYRHRQRRWQQLLAGSA